ncbi:MAG: hypothetical protein NVSMB64_00230 [Candidatus Velthaea sp.]
MSRKPKLDDFAAEYSAPDVFAAEVLAARLRSKPAALDTISLIQSARQTLRPISRFEKRKAPSVDAFTDRGDMQ